MSTSERTVWQRYLRPFAYTDAVLRVILSVGLWLIIGWLLPVRFAVVLVSGLVPALGLLLSAGSNGRISARATWRRERRSAESRRRGRPALHKPIVRNI